jgi:hypothetical protein
VDCGALNHYTDSGYWSYKNSNPSNLNDTTKMTYTLEFCWGCGREKNDAATIRQPEITDSNLVGQLDSSGFSVLIVGVTLSDRVDVSTTTQSLNCPKGQVGTKAQADVHLAWIERRSWGLNPGLGPVSIDIGLSSGSDEVVATKDYVFTVECCAEKGGKCAGTLGVQRKGSAILRQYEGLWGNYSYDQGSGWNPPTNSQIGPAKT